MAEAAVAATEDERGTPVTAVEAAPDLVVEIASDEKGARPQLTDEQVAALAEPPAEDEISRYARDAQKRIKSLHLASQEWKRRVIKANNDVATATNLAQELYQENQRLKVDRARSDQAVVEQAILRAEANLGQARGKLKTAFAAQDVDAIAAAQEEMARYVAEADRLRLLKGSAPSAEAAGPPAGSPAAPAAAAPPPRPLSEPFKQWRAQNQWFNTPGNEALTGFALGVHNELVNQGVSEESDPAAYYAAIDKRMRETFPSRFANALKPNGAPAGAAIEAEPRGARPVAVVGGTRVSGAAVSGKPRHVTLTESQVRLAKNLGLTNEQYAAQLIKEGKAN
jgi:hypothetical protein